MAVTKTFTNTLNNNGDGGHLCLVLNASVNASKFYPLNTMMAVSLLYIALIVLQYIPSILIFKVF